MLLCPYCQQDYLWKVHLNDLQRTVVFCFECDTVWLTEDDVEHRNGQNYEDFMTRHGMKASWNEIEKVRML